MIGIASPLTRAAVYESTGVRLTGRRVQLDAIAVGIEDLDPDRHVVVLPLDLLDARRPQALARLAHLAMVATWKPKWLVRGSRGGSPTESASTEPSAPPRMKLVIVQPLGEAEVLGVEAGRPLAVGDRQRHVVERHGGMIGSDHWRICSAVMRLEGAGAGHGRRPRDRSRDRRTARR